jgi:hypothetical protein
MARAAESYSGVIAADGIVKAGVLGPCNAPDQLKGSDFLVISFSLPRRKRKRRRPTERSITLPASFENDGTAVAYRVSPARLRKMGVSDGANVSIRKGSIKDRVRMPGVPLAIVFVVVAFAATIVSAVVVVLYGKHVTRFLILAFGIILIAALVTLYQSLRAVFKPASQDGG